MISLGGSTAGARETPPSAKKLKTQKPEIEMRLEINAGTANKSFDRPFNEPGPQN